MIDERLTQAKNMTYRLEKVAPKFAVHFEGEAVWEVQGQMVELSQQSTESYSEHFPWRSAEGELDTGQRLACFERFVNDEREGERIAKGGYERYRAAIEVMNAKLKAAFFGAMHDAPRTEAATP